MQQLQRNREKDIEIVQKLMFYLNILIKLKQLESLRLYF